MMASSFWRQHLSASCIAVAAVAATAAGCGSDSTPVPPVPLTGATAIAAGRLQACAVMNDGSARCWGSSQVVSLAPAPAGVSGVVRIAPGGSHICALLNDGSTSCWGSNHFGELGRGTQSLAVEPPAAVANLDGALFIAATGQGFIGLDPEYSCAVLPGGAVDCWGDNMSGELGTPPGPPYPDTFASLTPQEVPGVSGATAVALAERFGCALISDGTVLCWGTLPDSATPVPPTQVAGLTNAVALAAGTDHVCALATDGTVLCWGRNTWGQVAPQDQSGAPTVTSPVVVAQVASVTALAAGGNHTCALIADGSVRCWGESLSGQLGDGVSNQPGASGPVAVAGITDATGIAAGNDFTCALHAVGTVSCWGNNDAGQLGLGSRSPANSAVPVDVVSGPH